MTALFMQAHPLTDGDAWLRQLLTVNEMLGVRSHTVALAHQLLLMACEPLRR